jgi:membrane-associated protease RseP (regulator of RpoE activity)
VTETPPPGTFPPLEGAPPPSRPWSVLPAASAEPEDPGRPSRWWINLLLLLATVPCVFLMGARMWGGGPAYAIPLLSILLTHEAGHYVAARWHREPASLPYFLPLPFLSPFCTLGAVIVAPERIRSRRALLDIGAAGPLAGMTVCIPLLVYGLTKSPVGPLPAAGYTQEGQCLLYWAVKRCLFGPIPAGHDVIIHPVAAGAWAGLFVTFLNLFPVAQLDGGHVAYALLGPRHRWVARGAALLLPGLLLYNLYVFGGPMLRAALHHLPQRAGAGDTLWSAVGMWLVLGLLVRWIRRRVGLEHPPVDDEAPLGWGRGLVAVLTLGLFVALFMPSPLISY